MVAGIQSAYRRPELLGRRDLVIVDECHLIPVEGDGMYRSFFAESRIISPHQRVLGLTATPFRLKDGMICGPDSWLHEVIYEISVRDLIEQGYLCQLSTKSTRMKIDTSGLHKRAGEFRSEEIDELMRDADIVAGACAEIVEYTKDRNAVLIFAANVDHAVEIAARLRDTHSVDVDCVFGHTPKEERSRIIERFRSGQLKYLVNVIVLTTGFDVPHIDCVALVRPTLSPGLYYQMVGRGFRLHPSKDNCLILDYGGNAMRHGPVDDLRIKPKMASTGGESEPPAKVCTNCHEIVSANCRECPMCGQAFVFNQVVRHDASASDAPILSTEKVAKTRTTYDVKFIDVYPYISKTSGREMVRVDYWTKSLRYRVSEYLSFGHEGYPGKAASEWFRKLCEAARPSAMFRQLSDAKRCSLTMVPFDCEEAANAIKYLTDNFVMVRTIDVEHDPSKDFKDTVKSRKFETLADTSQNSSEINNIDNATIG